MLPATPLSIIRAVIYNVKTMVNGRGTFRNSAKPVDARLQGILDVIHQLSVSPSETQEKSTAVLKTMSIVTNAREFLESLPAHLDHEALWVDKIAVWKANSERFYDLNKRLSDHLDSLSSLFPNSPPELTQGHCKSDWWTIALKDLHDEVDRALSRLLSDVLSGDDLPAELEDLLHAIETLPTVIAPICIEFAVVDVAVQELLAFVQRTAQEIRTRHSNSTEQLTPSSYADASYASPIAISRLSPTRDRMSPFSR